MIFIGQASLCRAIKGFVMHYYAERIHQGLGNRLIRPQAVQEMIKGPIRLRQRLGGILNRYCRVAA
jgi:hypothetical protein